MTGIADGMIDTAKDGRGGGGTGTDDALAAAARFAMKGTMIGHAVVAAAAAAAAHGMIGTMIGRAVVAAAAHAGGGTAARAPGPSLLGGGAAIDDERGTICMSVVQEEVCSVPSL